MAYCRSTSNYCYTLILSILPSLAACAAHDAVTPEADIVHGTIAYPFVDESPAIGREPPDEKFVIKSAVGGTEYSVQIPGGARDYDVQVPLAELGAATSDTMSSTQKNSVNPVNTDKEILAAFPQLKKERPVDTSLMDSAFGTGEMEGPKQSPSYTLGIIRINDNYKKRNYELALIDINNLLGFYPNSPQLHKMKGTVLLKLRNLQLAELAWIKALELAPRDKALQNALQRLQKRIIQEGKAKNLRGPAPAPSIPQPIGTTGAKFEDVLQQ